MKRLALPALFLSAVASAASFGGYLEVGRNATLFQGIPLTTTVPSDGQCYVYSAADNDWAPNSCGGGGGGGATGPTGARGATGATGSNGSAGAAGATGTTGGTGSNGSAGSAGSTGVTGATGAIGSIGTFNNTSTANGLDVTGSVLTLHAADGTNPGALTTAAQNIAGAKTFTSTIIAPSGITAGTGNAQTAAGYFQQDTNNFTGINMHGTGTSWSINFPSSSWGLGLNGSNSNVILMSADKSVSIQPGNAGAGTGIGYGFEAAYPSTSTATTTYAQILSNAATNPGIYARDRNTTTGILNGFWGVGGSDRVSGGIAFPCSTQTLNSEVCSISIGSQNAGTLTEHFRIASKGQVSTGGNPPAAGTCGSSPGAPTGSDNAFKITSGTGGVATSCAVTLTATPTGGHCDCSDDTASATLVAVGIISSNTVTISTYSRTSGLSTAFGASDVFSCGCNLFF